MLLSDKLVEARIGEAIERGELDDLPGAGKPLELDDDRHVPEELRVGYRILKNAGCVPPELELRKELHNVEQLLVNVEGASEKNRLIKKINFLMTRLSVTRGTELNFHLEAAYYEKLRKKLGGTA